MSSESLSCRRFFWGTGFQGRPLAPQGANRAGGLIGAAPIHNMPTPHALCNCYVQDCDVQGCSPVGGLVGEFGDGHIYGCWSVADVWDIAQNQTYPFLRRFVDSDDNTDCNVD